MMVGGCVACGSCVCMGIAPWQAGLRFLLGEREGRGIRARFRVSLGAPIEGVSMRVGLSTHWDSNRHTYMQTLMCVHVGWAHM